MSAGIDLSLKTLEYVMLVALFMILFGLFLGFLGLGVAIDIVNVGGFLALVTIPLYIILCLIRLARNCIIKR